MKRLYILFCVLAFSILIGSGEAANAIDIPIDISDERIAELEITQQCAHSLAESARQLGCAEDGTIIEFARDTWWAAENEIREIEYWKEQRDIEIIAVVIYNEALGGCSDRHRELVAAVILNRVADDRFPDTVAEVVGQPGQYQWDYVNSNSYYYQKAISDTDNFNHCLEIAQKAINGEVVCPANVIYQSNYPSLGSGYYECHYTSYSVTYFAYR